MKRFDVLKDDVRTQAQAYSVAARVKSMIARISVKKFDVLTGML
jgi:hypothetical protein